MTAATRTSGHFLVSNPFPENIRKIIKNEPGSSWFSKIEQAFSNTPDLKAYIAWAGVHAVLVSKNETLGRIDAIAQKCLKKVSVQPASSETIPGTHLAYSALAFVAATGSQWIQDRMGNGKIPILDVLELYYIGLSTPQEFVSQINERYDEFFRDEVLTQTLVTMVKLDHEVLVDLLSLMSNDGSRPLSKPNLFTILRPVLNILKKEDIKYLLALKDQKGKTCLHDPEMCSFTFPLIETLDAPQVKYLLMDLKDKQGDAPICHFSIFGRSLQLLEKHKLFLDAFAVSNGEGRPLLSLSTNNYTTFKHLQVSLTYLEKLIQEDGGADKAKALIQKAGKNGETLLHNPHRLSLAWTLIEKLQFVDEALQLKDQQNVTPFHIFCTEFNYDAAQPCIQPFCRRMIAKDGGPKLLQNLLVTPIGDQGSTVLHHRVGIKLVQPALAEFSPDEITELLKVQDLLGDTPLHDERTAQIVLPLIQTKLTQANLIAIFSIMNINGNTPLHNKKVLGIMYPIFSKMDVASKLLTLYNKSDVSVLRVGLERTNVSETCIVSSDDIQRIYGVQFNITAYDLKKRDDESCDDLESIIRRWVLQQPASTAEKSVLYFPLLLGYTDFVVEKLQRLPPAGRDVLYNQAPTHAQKLKELVGS